MQPTPLLLTRAPRLPSSPHQLTSGSSAAQADEQQQPQQAFDADGLAAQWSREFAELLYDDMHPSERTISGDNFSYLVRRKGGMKICITFDGVTKAARPIFLRRLPF
jgi:hypothetical protein